MSYRQPRRQHEAELFREDGSRWTPDAVFSVRLSRSWEVTSHPVERGVVVSDHQQRQPAELTLSVGISETPIGPGAGQGGILHLRDRLEWLEDTANQGLLCDVLLRRKGLIRNFAITSVPLEFGRLSSLTFDLGLKEIRKATARTVVITVSAEVDADVILDEAEEEIALIAVPETDSGEQPTTDTSVDPVAEEQDQSVLASLFL